MKITAFIRDITIALAGVCILIFWICGWNGLPDLAAYFLIAGGIFSWVAIFAMIIKRIFYRNYII